jgi:hypothetical protein
MVGNVRETRGFPLPLLHAVAPIESASRWEFVARSAGLLSLWLARLACSLSCRQPAA